MKSPRVLVYETDGRLAALLRPLADNFRWSLRELRRPEAVYATLSGGGPSVVVLRLSTDRVTELTMLDTIAWLYPETAVVVVLDGESASLVGLAWDLGASYVLGPGQGREVLPDLVRGLMAVERGISKRSRPSDDEGTAGP